VEYSKVENIIMAVAVEKFGNKFAKVIYNCIIFLNLIFIFSGSNFFIFLEIEKENCILFYF